MTPEKAAALIPDLPIHGGGEARPPFVTASAMLDHAAATAPDTIALRHRGTALRYAELDRAAQAFARRLADRVAPGDVVGFLLPNGPEFAVAFFGTLRALGAPAPANPGYPAPQLAALFANAGARALVCSDRTRALAQTLADDLGIPPPLCIDEDLPLARLAAEPPAPLGRRQPAPDDIGVLLFSGGTTGLSKAVEHSQLRLAIAARCMAYNWPTRAQGEVWLPIAPFFHIYGFMQGVVNPVYGRATAVIPERFQPDHILDLLVRERVTVFGGGPPAIYAGLLAAEGLAQADLAALRLCPAGGAPFPVELLERWRRITGREIHEGYGMTEMAAIAGVTARSGWRPGSVGKPIPCNTVQIVDIETGTRVLPPGETGEVRVRGPHMMLGYRNNPEETARTLRYGFIHTGDIGRIDADGFLFITDRRKDVVFVKGFNVFPREVEEAIYTHPQVAAAGVVGVPDPRTGGEKLAAFVVPRAGAGLDAAAIAAHCAEHLVAYKIPAEIRIVEALPMTGAAKLDRMALRRLAEA